MRIILSLGQIVTGEKKEYCIDISWRSWITKDFIYTVACF